MSFIPSAKTLGHLFKQNVYGSCSGTDPLTAETRHFCGAFGATDPPLAGLRVWHACLGPYTLIQLTQWPSETSLSSGTVILQSGIISVHLVWNGHPSGGLSGDGMSPPRTTLFLLPGLTLGTAARRALVYGCSGPPKSSSVPALSTILPRYITATASLMWLTTWRSCAMNRYERWNSSCNSSSRFIICA